MTGGRILACAALVGLALLPGAAHATTDPPEPRAPEQGSYLRLDADPDDFTLSPGDSVQWRVGVDLLDPPTPGEIALRVGAAGSLADVPGGMTLSIGWCEGPGAPCEDGTTVLPPTPATELPDEPLELAGAPGGWLLVTAAVPDDAPSAAQGRELRVGVDARAQGQGAQAPDGEPSDPAVPTPDSPPEAAPPTERLPVSGAPLLAPALLAAASVLGGAGLAGARRLAQRRKHDPEAAA